MYTKIQFFQIFLSESLIFCERVNERFAQKKEGFPHLLFYHERHEQISHGRSFVMSNLRDSLMVALLSRAT